MQLTFFLAFTLLAAGQALFLSVLLFRQRERLGGERWLAALLMVLAIELAAVIYQRGGLYRSWPELIAADTWTTYVYGPMLWLFVRAATGRPHPVNARLWLHFLPALLANLAVYALLAPLSLAERVALIDAGLAAPAEPAAWQFDPFALTVAVQVALYLRASWRRVNDYRQRLLAERSTLRHTPLGWLRVVLRVFFVAWLCFVFLNLFYGLLGLQQLAGPFMAGVLIVMVFYLAWRAWRAQPVRLVLAEAVSGPGALAFAPGGAALSSGDHTGRPDPSARLVAADSAMADSLMTGLAMTAPASTLPATSRPPGQCQSVKPFTGYEISDVPFALSSSKGGTAHQPRLADKKTPFVGPFDRLRANGVLLSDRRCPPAGRPLAEAAGAETGLVSSANAPPEVLPTAPPKTLPETSTESVTEAAKYQRSALDQAAALQVFAEVDAAMRRSQWWRDPELDLAGLAERSGYSAHYLSQAINSGSGSHFYDYINQFRVEAVKQALTAGSRETVLSLALAAGFNSKSAFYTVFKRSTGLTPKAFQRQCQAAGG